MCGCLDVNIVLWICCSNQKAKPKLAKWSNLPKESCTVVIFHLSENKIHPIFWTFFLVFRFFQFWRTICLENISVSCCCFILKQKLWKCHILRNSLDKNIDRQRFHKRVLLTGGTHVETKK